MLAINVQIPNLMIALSCAASIAAGGFMKVCKDGKGSKFEMPAFISFQRYGAGQMQWLREGCS